MDRASVSPRNLYSRLGTAAAPPIIDVRRAEAFDADDTMIIGAIRRSSNVTRFDQFEIDALPWSENP